MADTKWTPDALDAHWQTSRGYANRLVNGEKSWSVERMLSLPDDLEARLEHLRAEHFGRIVIEPVDEATAAQQFATGLFCLLMSSRLPATANALAKASLRPAAKKASLA